MVERAITGPVNNPGRGAGGLVQTPGSVQTGAVVTGTTAIPNDDTIPQITEGDEYMTLAYTPKATDNILIIEVVFAGAQTNATGMVVALFQDTTANALAGMIDFANADFHQNISLTHKMTAGTTSATTFRVRAGGNTGATTTFNGASSGRILGDVAASSITIREYLP